MPMEKPIEAGGSTQKVIKNAVKNEKVTTFGENLRPGQYQPYVFFLILIKTLLFSRHCPGPTILT